VTAIWELTLTLAHQQGGSGSPLTVQEILDEHIVKKLV
jgi:hypothetical protein